MRRAVWDETMETEITTMVLITQDSLIWHPTCNPAYVLYILERKVATWTQYLKCTAGYKWIVLFHYNSLCGVSIYMDIFYLFSSPFVCVFNQINITTIVKQYNSFNQYFIINEFLIYYSCYCTIRHFYSKTTN